MSLTRQVASQIRVLLSDVDGVLTDGTVTYDSSGVEAKSFHVRDGLAIKRWIAAGNVFVIVTARHSAMVDRRATELGIDLVIQNCADKTTAVAAILRQHDFTWDQAAYIGDDIADIGPITHSRLGWAPADACADVVEVADCVLQTRGGGGVVREMIEIIMRAAGTWPATVAVPLMETPRSDDS